MQAFGKCADCSLPRERRVPGHGCTDSPDIMIIGEAPGAEEVAQGRPFVGRAGKLLREILTGLHVDTSRVYYTNACCCRPPLNRTPKASDVMACKRRLVSEIDEIQPKIIVALGNTAMSALLGGGTGISRRRGMYQEIELPSGLCVGVIPALHPAGILRMPDGFRDLADDLSLAVDIVTNGTAPVIEPPYGVFEVIDTESLPRLIARIQRGGPVAIDVETTSLNPREGEILCCALSWDDCTMVFDWQELSLSRMTSLARALIGCEGIYHNGQFDVQWLMEYGLRPGIIADTMLMHYCLDERKGSHGLKRLATQYYRAPEYDAAVRPTSEDGRKAALTLTLDDWMQDEALRQTVMMYNAADAYYTRRLYDDLGREMREDDVSWVHDAILIPAVRHFIRLEMDGMLVDTDYLQSVGEEWMAEILSLEDALRKYPGAGELNLRSSKQVQEFLFDTLGLHTMPEQSDGTVSMETALAETSQVQDDDAQEFWRTSQFKRGTKARSTGTYMLFWLAQQHEFPRLMVRHRILSKQYGAYHDGYVRLMDEQSRIRPRYRLHGTRTGRLSSTDPNIHGMPRRKQIKRIFIADPGMTIIAPDYSQAEIRMVAHLADDDNLIAALNGQDIHYEISKRLFSMTDAQMKALTEEERSIKRRAAKTIAFGIIYGRSPPSIAPQMGVTVDKAEEYVHAFYHMMPKVREWIARQHALVMKDREVATIFGRKRRFPLVLDKRHAAEIRRQAVNFPVQSAVSDMCLMANMRIIDRLDAEGIACKVWPHVHDGFYFLVEDKSVARATEIAIEELHDLPFETRVPFAVEIQAGKNWGDLKAIYEG
jgi:DNA polymerase-1